VKERGEEEEEGEEEEGGSGSSVFKRRTKRCVLKCCLEFLMM